MSLHLGDGHMGSWARPAQDSTGCVLTQVSGLLCHRVSLSPCPAQPCGSLSGSCIVPVTQKNLPTVLGSYVALNKTKALSPHQTSLEAPAVRQGCQLGLLAPLAGSSLESKVTATITEG